MATCSYSYESSCFLLNYFIRESCSELGLSQKIIWNIYTSEKAFYTNWAVCVFLGFLDSMISKILTFSNTLISVGKPSRKTTVVPFPFTTATQRKDPFKRYNKKFHEAMDISSLLNTDLGLLNDSSLILQDDRLSMYNTFYIFLKFTCMIGKKN